MIQPSTLLLAHGSITTINLHNYYYHSFTMVILRYNNATTITLAYNATRPTSRRPVTTADTSRHWTRILEEESSYSLLIP